MINAIMILIPSIMLASIGMLVVGNLSFHYTGEYYHLIWFSLLVPIFTIIFGIVFILANKEESK